MWFYLKKAVIFLLSLFKYHGTILWFPHPLTNNHCSHTLWKMLCYFCSWNPLNLILVSGVGTTFQKTIFGFGVWVKCYMRALCNNFGNVTCLFYAKKIRKTVRLQYWSPLSPSPSTISTSVHWNHIWATALSALNKIWNVHKKL